MRAVGCAVVLFWLVAETAASQDVLTIRGQAQQLHLYGTKGSPPIILSSGDLGWAGLVVHVAEFLASKGYYIIGFNTRAYLAGFMTKDSALDPKDVPTDYMALVQTARQSSRDKPVLAGVSEGAGLSVLAATKPDLKPLILGVLGLGLPDENELGWKWSDFTIWITKKTPKEPSFMVEDIIGKIGPVPLAEIHSTHDEFLSLSQAKEMFARGSNPKKMWVIDAANHRFSDNREGLDSTLLEALQWLRAQAR
jgi:hypothetical protein